MLIGGVPAQAAAAPYQPIAYDATATVVLSGNDLSVTQLVQIARHGAKVTLSAAAKEQQSKNYGLLLEAQAEGVPVYGFNHGGGLARSVKILEGDPLSVINKARVATRELAAFEQGVLAGDGPELIDEARVRAAMAIRANQMVHEAPSPQLATHLLDLLNGGISPVMQSRGTVGESDFNLLPNIGGALVGKGDAYYHGVRMPAAQALKRAGLSPLKPFGMDSSTLFNSNGYSTALAAFLVFDGQRALDWTDLADAMDLTAMNSSITPLSAPVQLARPDPWLNWDAARVLDMVRGGYLFDSDPGRLLTDPDSLRASAIRQGAAWLAWSRLRETVERQMNSSDHNPSIKADLAPSDSWELATPQMMQYYIKGGGYSNGVHGYIVTSANWDPYPLVNDIEAFTNALVNAGVAVTQRIYRFNNVFFTAVKPDDLLPAGRSYAPQANPTLVANLWQEMQMLANPVPASGISTDVEGNGDIQSQASIKATRGLDAADLMLHLVAQDVLTSAHWLNLRKLQDPSRHFGVVVDAAWGAFRRVVPWDHALERSPATVAYEFVNGTAVKALYPTSAETPDSHSRRFAN